MIIDNLLKLPYWVWIFTVLLGVPALCFLQQLYVIRSLPPGPFPLPILGNLLAFRGKENLPHFLVPKWRKKYGDVFTIWLGPRPTIMVCGWDYFKECLVIKRDDFAGRMKRKSVQIIFNYEEDVSFGDFGPCWETLKKTITSAIRKYSVSQNLAIVVADVVDEVIEEMLKEGKPFDGKNYCHLTIIKIVASSSFGKRFSDDDEDLNRLIDSHEKISEIFGEGLPSDFLPFMSFFHNKKEQLLMELSKILNGLVYAYYKDHKKTYEKGLVRDFTDSIIAAKEEALKESKESAQYFTKQNVINVIRDLFSGGIDTTSFVLSWALLHIANCPEIQSRMQKEIDENIGTRQPIQSDRENCSYTSAFIMEVLRKNGPFDFTLEHKSTCNTEIGEYKIPKGTLVMFYMTSIHHDERNWKDPEEFNPERFLESDGKLSSTKRAGYAPFGAGHRGCPGEKLIIAEMFLIITRILQKLNLELEGGPGSASFEFDVFAVFNKPKHLRLVVKKRSL